MRRLEEPMPGSLADPLDEGPPPNEPDQPGVAVFLAGGSFSERMDGVLAGMLARGVDATHAVAASGPIKELRRAVDRLSATAPTPRTIIWVFTERGYGYAHHWTR